jgi:hypothetical protein
MNWQDSDMHEWLRARATAECLMEKATADAVVPENSPLSRFGRIFCGETRRNSSRKML